MLTKISKIFRNTAITLMIFGVVFSNIPFYVLTGMIGGYVKTANIVDRAWHLSQNKNIVDKFTSYRNLAEKVKINEARAAVNGDGVLLYGKSTNNGIWARNFTGPLTISGETNIASSITDTVRYIRQESSPTRQETIAVVQTAISTTGSGIFALRQDAASAWTIDWCVRTGGGTFGGTTCTNATYVTNANTVRRGFDVAYENTSGDAIVVYSTGGTTNELAYRQWNGSIWTGETQFPSARLTGVVEWIELDAKRTASSNEITALFADANRDLSALVWDGTSTWGTEPAAALDTEIEDIGAGTNPTVRSFGGAYETSSGDYLAGWGYSIAETEATEVRYVTRASGGAWGSVTTPTTWPEIATVVQMEADYASGSNYIILASQDPVAADNQCATWSGSAWPATPANCDTTAGAQIAGNHGFGIQVLTNTVKRGVVVWPEAASANMNFYTSDPATNTWTLGTAFALTGATSAITTPVETAKDPFNGGKMAAVLQKGTGIHFVVGDMNTSGTVTWTNPNNAAVTTSPTTGLYQPFSFAYYRFVAAVAPNATSFTNSTESGLNNLGARVGQTVVVSGTSFGADPGAGNRSSAANNVKVGTYQIPDANVTAWSATSITFNIPSAINVYGANLTVTAGSQADATPLNFKVYPDITSLSASEAKEGDTIATISGTRFGTGAGANAVTIDGVAATGCTWSDTSITNCVVPAGINDANNSVTIRVYQGTGGDNALYDDSTGFIILPKITSWPGGDATRENDSATFGGNHFGATQGTVAFTGDFGSVAASVTGWTADTSFTVTVPTGISDSVYLGDITLTRNSDFKTATAYGGNVFRILPMIISTGSVDAKGAQGQAITIAGNHFCQDGAVNCGDYVTDSDDITFNTVSAKASITAMSDISISVSVPATATDGNLIITSDSANNGITYTSNSYFYNVKFEPSTPTGSSADGSNNPTLNGAAFSDGTDGDTHYKTTWQVAHNSDGDWTTPEWIRTSGTAEIGTTVNDINGTFQNGDTGQTALDCGTIYKGRVRYMDNGNAGADTQTWEWSSYSVNYTFTTASCNVAPTLTITQPDGVSDSVNIGQLYNITYNLSDPEQIVTVDFYYDNNGFGLDGTMISGCQNQPEGTDATCAWDTTGMTAGDYYVYGRDVNDGIAPEVSDYSSGVLTITVPPQVTAASSGTQTINFDSGDTNQYIGAAFTFQQNNGIADTITALTISETGSVDANANLSANAGIRYESGVASCTYNGIETLVSDTFDVTTDKMTMSGLSIPVTVGSNYTCVYVVFDISSNAVGGQIIDLEITGLGDFTLQNSMPKVGAYPVQLGGTTTIRPNVTSYDNVSEIALNNLGARNGQNITINGAGFGTACGSISVQVEAAITCTAANNTTISATVSSTQITTYGGTNNLLVTVGGTQDDIGKDFYIYPEITAPPGGDAARENDNITLGGKRFGATQGTINFVGNFGNVAATSYVSWTDTSITVVVPDTISDSIYTGDIKITRAADTGSKDDLAYNGNVFRVLPRITSVDPTQPIKGESVTINGDHLCQVGAASCPTGFNASNKITFYNGVDATAFNSWSNTSATTTVPTAAQTGGLIIKSNDYDSNSFNITLASTAPNDPDVGPGTNKGQYKSNGITTISIGGGTNEISVVFMASSSAQVNINLALQVEVDPIGTAFSEDNIVTGGTVSYSGTPVTASTSVSGLSTSTFQYHWRARLKNTTTNETSNWVAFGNNPSGNGSTDGSPATTDFYIDSFVEIINVCEVGPTATTCDSSMPSDIQAQIRWETNGGESATKWVRYSNAGITCPSGSTAADVFNAFPNAEPSSESSLTSSPLSVVLNGLTASSIYKYKIKSTDAFGNVAYYPSGTVCEEFQTATAKNRLMKTLEFYIEQSTATVNSFDKNFDVFISERSNIENNITFKSIIIEVFGLSKNSGNFDINVTLNGNLKTYTIADTGGNATYWSVIYNASDINYDHMYDSSANNILNVSSGASTNTLLGAKAIITYYYVPQ